jgi:hypothetical protein
MAFSEDIVVSDMQSVIDNIVTFATTNAGFTLHDTFLNASIVVTDTDAYTDMSILSKVNDDVSTDYAITSVTDNGGIARFNFTGPTLALDDFVIVKDFVVNTAYNGEYYITATDGTTYFETDVLFVTNETGNFTEGAYKMYYYLYATIIPTSPEIFPGGIGSLNCRMMIEEPTTTNFESTTANGQRYKTRTSTWGNIDGIFTGLSLYTDGEAVHVVLEVYPNVFAQLSFGKIAKFGAWRGGEYVTANNIRDYTTASGFTFFDIDTSTAIFSYALEDQVIPNQGGNYLYRPLSPPSNDYLDWAPTVRDFLEINETQRAFFTGYASSASNPNYYLHLFSPNTFNQRSMLMKIYVFLTEEFINTGQLRFMGHIPSVRYVNIEILNPKDIVDVNWTVYPYASKTGDPFTAPITSNHGLTYQRV